MNDRRRFLDIEICLDDYQDEVRQFVGLSFDPEEVFTVEELTRWAEDNGYKKETDDGR